MIKHSASGELISYDQDGNGVIEDHWFNVAYHPLRGTDGTVSGLVAVCSDVTVQVGRPPGTEAGQPGT